MCGIAGIYHLDQSKVDLAMLKRMTDIISHRGPDGEGHWISDNKTVGFGHRRLSIIDLSSNGNQPMSYLNNRYTITFNGEIYNYIELKKQLETKGFKFSSNSDTEVLLALYADKREDCLNDIDGMFSFAIWDEEEQSLFCARDRFGEKPFHYYHNDQTFMFGSEIKELFEGGALKEINYKKLQQFLNGAYIINGNETFFNSIKTLPPAHFITIKNGQISIQNYWKIDTTQKSNLDETSINQKFLTLFKTSVQRRLRSDVNVGSSLSGGLDSSAVVSVVDQIKEKNQKFNTYSARFHDPTKDEGKWIDLIEKSKDIQRNDIFLDEGLITNALKKIIYHHEIPVVSTSVFAQYSVMQLAKQKGSVVLLDGQGADEYLAGYDQYKYYIFNELYKKGLFKDFLDEKKAYKKHYGQPIRLGYLFLIDPILKIFNIKRELYKKGGNLKERLAHDLVTILPELLHYADRNSMAFSIEVRLPFLFHELVEFVLTLPNKHLYSMGYTKKVLREALKGIVPQEILDRKDKLGYLPPEKKWLEQPIFKKMIQTSKETLSENKLSPSTNDWKNIVASEFINQFST